MKQIVAAAGLIAAVSIAVALARAQDAPDPGTAQAGVPFEELIGKYCAVSFRDAASGSGGTTRSRSVSIGGVVRINDHPIGAEGTLVAVRDGWLHLTQGPDQSCWIPLEAVMAIENALSGSERMRQIREDRERR